MNLRETAQAYIPKKTKNISDMDVVYVSYPVFEKEAEDNDGETFSYFYISLDGEEYRVPNSVLATLKVILEKNPKLKNFNVVKTGEGKKTKYTVIPLESDK